MIPITREKIEAALNSVDSNWRFTGSPCHWNVGPIHNLAKEWNPSKYENAIKAIGANVTYNRMILYKGGKFEVKTETNNFQIHY